MDFANAELTDACEAVDLEPGLDTTDNAIGSSFLEEGQTFFGLEAGSISYAPSMAQDRLFGVFTIELFYR